MKKMTCLGILFFMLVCLYCEDIIFRVVEDSYLYDASYTYLDGATDAIAEIQKDEVVQFAGSMTNDVILVKNATLKKGWMKISTLIIEENIPASFDDITSSLWIMDYYYSILHSKNKDDIFLYESYWKDVWKPGLFDRPDYNWTDYFHPITFKYSRISIYIENLFFYSGVPFIITSIIENDDGYEIPLHNVFSKLYDNTEYLLGLSEILYGLSDDKFILKIDGDYLTIYLNDLDNKLCTLVKSDENTIKEIGSFVIDGEVNYENVTWPRHADGSCDFEKPLQTAKGNTDRSVYEGISINASMTTTDNLRLRIAEETTSDILTTLEMGTRVKVKAIGKQQTIDGITSNWVKVKIEDGTEGWCFGGYLVEVSEEMNSSEPTNTDDIERNNTDEGNINVPPFPLLPVAGGAVLVIVIALVVVIARRKKR